MADPEEKQTLSQEDESVSSEDEDFNPEAVDAAQDDDELSSSEDETPQPKKSQKKRKKTQDAEELDSGDEATIKERRKSKKRKTDEDEDEESGGEGGLIKTRAQRRAEKEERQEYRKANVEDVTVDVDALWAAMSSKPIGRAVQEPQKPSIDSSKQRDTNDKTKDEAAQSTTIEADDDDGMITINRTYDFAGQTITEQKVVLKSSAEAKLYLSNNPTNTSAPAKPAPSTQKDTHLLLRRPLRRPSKYEPNPTGEVKGLPLERQRLRTPSRADVLALQLRQQEEEAKKNKAVKLNTVQKSAIDWAAHVDQEGLQEELDEYGRSKQGYVGKMDFLRNVHGRKEEEDRRARLGGSSAAAV